VAERELRPIEGTIMELAMWDSEIAKYVSQIDSKES
jgi:hypothetical protein